MDAQRVDSISRTLTELRSRRGTLTALLGSLLGLAGSIQTAAKKKKRGKKRKKTKGFSPPPVTPITTADASCRPPLEVTDTSPRQAQTFRALRSGQLTRASVLLRENPAEAIYEMEIWSVNQANAPSAVLASTRIRVPDQHDPPGPLTLEGTFAAPATVMAGQRYALVLTSVEGYPIALYGALTDQCPDGNWFVSNTVNGAFTADPTADLSFATFVTA